MAEPILQKGSSCWDIFPVEGSGVLVDAANYYRAFVQTASSAESYIFIAGWQFDSEVPLLRGRDAAEETRFLPFLERLCARTPGLRVYVLAWDFSSFFAAEREWFQQSLFTRSGRENLRFLFDPNHPIYGSHHQKFVVVDGAVAFAGGADICSNRWDERSHLAYNPLRFGTDGRHYEPYHDIQCYLCGEGAAALGELFRERWRRAGGEEIPPLPPHPKRFELRHRLPVACSRIAIARTDPKTLLKTEDIREIRLLYLAAIDAAESLIYLENQYFSSDAVYGALERRMRQPGRPKLQIVMIIPRHPQALAEEVSHGIRQMRMLRSLQETASRTGHSLGIYYTVSPSGGGEGPMVYIHSKLLLVDDRFLTVGSANTTNRSFGLDTELNVAWEGDADDRGLCRSIRSIRVSLLLEHAGLCGYRGWRERRRLASPERLVETLERLAERERSPLRRHTLDTLFQGREWLLPLEEGDVAFDPESPVVEEAIFEVVSRETVRQFSENLECLKRSIREKTAGEAGGVVVVAPQGDEKGKGCGAPVTPLLRRLLVALLLLSAYLFLARLLGWR